MTAVVKIKVLFVPSHCFSASTPKGQIVSDLKYWNGASY